MRALFNWGLSLLLRAEIASDQGRPAESAQMFAAGAEKFDAALSLDEDSAEAFVRLAQCLVRQVEDEVRSGGTSGDPSAEEALAELLDEAIEACEQALDVDPSDSNGADTWLARAEDGLAALGFESNV